MGSLLGRVLTPRLAAGQSPHARRTHLNSEDIEASTLPNVDTTVKALSFAVRCLWASVEHPTATIQLRFTCRSRRCFSLTECVHLKNLVQSCA